MIASNRFPVATHILVALHWNEGELLSSEQLANTVNTNAVVIRRLLPLLRKAGLVETLPGTQGGSRLIVDPKEISLLTIFRAVEGGPMFKSHCPNETCELGGVIEKSLAPIYAQAEEAMENVLAATSLLDFSRQACQNAGKTSMPG